MKLIIGGSTGFVGAELVQRALSHPAITTVVGISRRETPAPAESAGTKAKLVSVICDDFEHYPDHVKKELENADACIWTIAVTPAKLKSLPWEETVKVCRGYALAAIEAVAAAPRKQDKPLRFIYINGHFAPRDRSEVTQPMDSGIIELALLRGKLEDEILAYADQTNGAVVACIAKPGLISAPDRKVPTIPGLPQIERRDIAAALLHQAVTGFEKDMLSNDDMIRIGQSALSK
ncbi:hypothetical protein O1611_g4746 [Lasiodiplodia mahajangana]|uniref:Uncharacterized protein n=1 Tax=Lasiodiplodia mahajangana TaxID=1108764 RepID=A0ACC2JNW0_9PEZI|nr:hypothetical protein O1611_g4746 [Lasiodiplodia mahajangana]